MRAQNDSPYLGVLAGLILPLVGVAIFSLLMKGKFESIDHMINHFQLFDVWYKVLSLSLMPGAGLFFLWSKAGKMNQARATLLMTMFYGIFVIVLYLN